VGYKNYLECPVAQVRQTYKAAEISNEVEVCNSDRVKACDTLQLSGLRTHCPPVERKAHQLRIN
jgi:hypothetical protein